MAKRVYEETFTNEDVKFEIEEGKRHKLFVTVSPFMGDTYIHIRKYYNNLPSKYGVCFRTKEWYYFISYVNSNKEESTIEEKVEMKKLKNGTMLLSSLKAPMELYIRKPVMDVLLARYVSI